jgi:hypothetical protein
MHTVSPPRMMPLESDQHSRAQSLRTSFQPLLVFDKGRQSLRFWIRRLVQLPRPQSGIEIEIDPIAARREGPVYQTDDHLTARHANP